MFVDSHCHLDFPELTQRLPEVLANMAAAQVEHALCISVTLEDWPRVAALAADHEQLSASVGVHPDNEGVLEPTVDQLVKLSRGDKIVAIGETGLDYYRDRAPRDDQRRAFEAQIDLARRVELPLVIHTRAAEDDTFAILAEHARGITVLLHCFSAPDRLDECVERGYLCSFAGNVTYPKATELADAVARVPDDLLLVETDSPYLAPQTVRGKPNEPANVVATARFVAERRGIAYEQLEQIVERNAARLFGW